MIFWKFYLYATLVLGCLSMVALHFSPALIQEIEKDCVAEGLSPKLAPFLIVGLILAWPATLAIECYLQLRGKSETEDPTDW